MDNYLHNWLQTLIHIKNSYEWQSPFTTKFLISVIVICIISMWIRYLWSRRKLYAISRKLQGPLSLPLIGCSYLLYGDNYDILLKLINAVLPYKGVVRIWLFNRLVLTSIDNKHTEIILNHPNSLEKSDFYEQIRPILGLGLITAPVSKWKKQRKLVLKTFNSQILNDSIPIFVKYANILVKRISAICGQEKEDMILLISECTLDIICETGMGIDGTTVQKPHPGFGYHLDKSAESIFLKATSIFYHFDFIFKQTQYSKNLDEACKFFKNFTMKLILQKRSDLANYDNAKCKNKNVINKPAEVMDDGYIRKNKFVFLDQLINMSDSEQKFSNEDLYGEIMTYITAGSDTSTFTVGFVLLMLAMHTEIQDLVYEEIINVMGSNHLIEARHLSQLKYLEQVIKETLRIFPIAVLLIRYAQGEIDLQDGTIIPEGCNIAIPILLIHRNPDYWPNPLKFDPDRFSPTQIEKNKPYTYLPFSGGPRNCAGAHYAMLSMKTIISTVIKSFKVYTKYKSVEEVELKAHVVIRPKNGFHTYFMRR